MFNKAGTKYPPAEFKFITGKLSWVKSLKPDPDFNCWSCTVHPNAESLETIRDLQADGVKNVLKKDEDGYYITFRRPIMKNMRGALVTFPPPEVIDKEGKPLNDPIGNGSDGVLKLEVYTHGTPSGGRAKAARWLSLRVDNLVPFDIKEDFDEEQKRAIKGLDKQPAEVF